MVRSSRSYSLLRATSKDRFQNRDLASQRFDLLVRLVFHLNVVDSLRKWAFLWNGKLLFSVERLLSSNKQTLNNISLTGIRSSCSCTSSCCRSRSSSILSPSASLRNSVSDDVSGGHWSGDHWSDGHWSGGHWSDGHWSGHPNGDHVIYDHPNGDHPNDHHPNDHRPHCANDAHDGTLRDDDDCGHGFCCDSNACRARGGENGGRDSDCDGGSRSDARNSDDGSAAPSARSHEQVYPSAAALSPTPPPSASRWTP